ncbi:uncharacterized protein si:ch211-217g15.3 [Syngnathus acus]|uniref:uncharacterized protein si:ch211-217g15.3 n=1 Tax=Syngnathus acus TaxID=161584 RepID=UPI001885CDCB|nr:uncharacterized protein si:ch211-217g15.3 [Syngnathus acus]
MFRITLFVTLIFGIAAKPYKPWNKFSNKAFQDTMSEYGKLPLDVEVEPPEDMDETDYDIDPKMKIWNNVDATGTEKQLAVAEVDLDDVHHPSLKTFPAEYEEVFSEESEQDRDAVYHEARAQLDEYLAPLTAEYRMARLEQPQPDMTEALDRVRRHLEPEVDVDDLYHSDLQNWMSSYLDNDNAAAPLDWQLERNYDQPEEDLDHLYHL